MSKFKVGDKVRCIDDSPYPFEDDRSLTKGKVYTISKLHATESDVYVDEDQRSYSSTRFELVEDIPSKVSEALTFDTTIKPNTLTIKYNGITLDFNASAPFSRELVNGVLDKIYEDAAQ